MAQIYSKNMDTDTYVLVIRYTCSVANNGLDERANERNTHSPSFSKI